MAVSVTPMTTESGSNVPTNAAPSPAPRRLTSDRLIVAAETAVMAVLTFVTLGRQSFWIDEAYTWSLVHRPFGGFVHTMRIREAGAVAFALLEWAWTHAAGYSEAVMRTPAALFAVVTLPLVVAVARRLFGRRASLLAGAFFALNSAAIFWGKSARAYTLMLLLTVVSMYGLVRFVLDDDRRGWWIWVVAMVLLPYAQPLGLAIPAAQALSLPLLPGWRTRARAFVTGFAILVVTFAPLYLLLRGQNTLYQSWLEDGRSLRAIVTLYVAMTGAGGGLFHIVYDGVLVAALVIGVRTIRRRHAETLDAWRWGLLLSWLVVPPVLVLAASYQIHLWSGRYYLMCVPAITIAAAVVVDKVPTRRWATVLAVALVITNLHGLVLEFRDLHTDDYRAAVKHFLAAERPGDSVIFMYDDTRIAFEYYLWRDRDRPVEATSLFPRGPWYHYGVGDPQVRLPRGPEIDRDVAGVDRVWVFVVGGKGLSPMRLHRYDSMRADFARTWQHKYPGALSAWLFTRRPGNPAAAATG